MQKNQQSVGLFARMLCSCFECTFVFILINPPVLTAPVITKLIFLVCVEPHGYMLYLMKVRGGLPLGIVAQLRQAISFFFFNQDL